jgi:hypothetical protein
MNLQPIIENLQKARAAKAAEVAALVHGIECLEKAICFLSGAGTEKRKGAQAGNAKAQSGNGKPQRRKQPATEHSRLACAACGKTFVYAKALATHQAKAHAAPKPTTGEIPAKDGNGNGAAGAGFRFPPLDRVALIRARAERLEMLEQEEQQS